jgi:multimeric flavodoxin WrbA
MNALIISGSRSPSGQTARAAEALAAGYCGAGGQVETVFLPDLKIEHCRQCDDAGWGICQQQDRCIIEDDFAGLVAKLRAADAAVFATPVYFSDLSESLRAFADRLRRTCRRTTGQQGLTGKPALGLCVAGGGGGGAPACARSLEKYLAICGFEVVDMVPVRRQNLETKLELLNLTGRWLAARSKPQK